MYLSFIPFSAHRWLHTHSWLISSDATLGFGCGSDRKKKQNRLRFRSAFHHQVVASNATTCFTEALISFTRRRRRLIPLAVLPQQGRRDGEMVLMESQVRDVKAACPQCLITRRGAPENPIYFKPATAPSALWDESDALFGGDQVTP